VAATIGARVSRMLEVGSIGVSEEGSRAKLKVDIPEAGSLAIKGPSVGNNASRAWACGVEEPLPPGGR